MHLTPDEQAACRLIVLFRLLLDRGADQDNSPSTIQCAVDTVRAIRALPAPDPTWGP